MKEVLRQITYQSSKTVFIFKEKVGGGAALKVARIRMQSESNAQKPSWKLRISQKHFESVGYGITLYKSETHKHTS